MYIALFIIHFAKEVAMGKTSTDSKRKYNAKTYTRWAADLRNEDFQKIEALRGDLSRSQFLKKLINAYKP